MEREVIYKKIRSIKELREFITDYLIEHSEMRAKAMLSQNTFVIAYEQGFLDALKTIRDLLSKEGLLMYRYVFNEEQKREEDENRDTF
ncbi:MAG: hypothetical protein DRN54_03885 [Thaumarchaeota archaeon]|nr:MAG: hypothetical protein DRN52_06495 [Thermococci archaeon]RLG02841.1 MAG: hypothetical protein DRN54_03885 [Nitrososphaerota archaeon]